MVASSAPPEKVSDDVTYWVTLSRKVIQRGQLPRGRTSKASPDLPVNWSEVVSWLFTGREQAADPCVALHPKYEAPFFADLCALHPSEAAFVIPQAPLEALAGLSRPAANWVDFVLAVPGHPVSILEIDGPQHVGQRAADGARNRLLSAAGMQTVRVEPVAGRLNSARLFEAVRQAALGNKYQASSLAGPLNAVRVAYGVVEAVSLGLLRPSFEWSVQLGVEIIDEPTLLMTLSALAALDRIWSTGVMPSKVQFVGSSSVIWRNPFVVEGHARTSTVEVHVDSAPTWARVDVPSNGVLVRGVPLPVCPGWDPPASLERRNLSPHDAAQAEVVEALETVSSYVFGLPNFRDGQARATIRVLTGNDSLVLLPTGSGKSLVYQLAALLRPGTTLVVDPIRALMDDQERRLLELGIDRVLAIHSGQSVSQADRATQLGDLANGRALAAFVSPERLLNEQFRESLQEAAHEGLINLAVVDEAHCVSEWGHDFRTSYLHLARNLRRLGRDVFDIAPPLLALTGTASPAVLRDVAHELGIDLFDGDALQRPESNDRPNLTFEVLAGADLETWVLVEKALATHIPSALGVSPQSLASEANTGTTSGVVFVPWAKGAYGVESVRGRVEKALHASGSPASVASYSGKMSDEARFAAAASFQRNTTQVLVATKAFGMGIDKPNIRWTLHVGIPSSIEAFVQEAGRAGRNGALARCVLVSGRPGGEVVSGHLSPSEGAAPRRARFNSLSRSSGLGDVGRQLFFHYGNFPGEAGPVGEIAATHLVIDELLAAGAAPLAILTVQRGSPALVALLGAGRNSGGPDAVASAFDKVIHRLTVLGIVDDVTMKFAGPGSVSTATLFCARFDRESLDRAFLAQAARVIPGRHQEVLAKVSSAPDDIAARIKYLAAEVIRMVYEVIEPARLTALREMWRLTCDEPDDARIRGTIAAYLGGGPMSLLLERLVAEKEINVMASLEAVQNVSAGDEYEWVGASARLLESYPDHPTLLYVRACGEAFSGTGSRPAFVEQIDQLLLALNRYGIHGWEDRFLLLEALSNVIRNARQGSVIEWAHDVWSSWFRLGGYCSELNHFADVVLRDPLKFSLDEHNAALIYRLMCHRADVRDRVKTP